MTTETQGKPASRVSIHINKEHLFIESPIMGAELRRLGGIPAESQLFREVPGDAPDELIRNDQSYDVKPGTKFYDLPRGTVGAAALEAQLALATERLPSATVARQSDGMQALRWRARLSSVWSPGEVDLIVLVPPQYPAQAPSGFDVVGELRFNGANAAGAGAREIAGEKVTHLCWNPAGMIDYTAEEGIWRFAKFSETRFLTLQ